MISSQVPPLLVESGLKECDWIYRPGRDWSSKGDLVQTFLKQKSLRSLFLVTTKYERKCVNHQTKSPKNVAENVIGSRKGRESENKKIFTTHFAFTDINYDNSSLIRKVSSASSLKEGRVEYLCANKPHEEEV